MSERWRPTPLIALSALLHALALPWLILRWSDYPWVLGVLVLDHLVLMACGLWPRSTWLGPNLLRLPDAAAARGEVAITIDDGPGPEATLAEYEVYAGISFACRGVHAALLNHERPEPPGTPLPDAATWRASLRRANDVRVCVHQNTFDEHAATPGTPQTLPGASSAVVTIYGSDESELHRETVEAADLPQYRQNGWLDYRVIFFSALERIPARYIVELRDEAGNLLSRVGNAIVV